MNNSIRNTEHYSSKKISNWHRSRLRKGFIAVDFDLLEYDSNGKPLAIFEYKHFFFREIKLKNPALVALASLATSADIPAFLVCYALVDDYDLPTIQQQSEFFVVPMNDRARLLVPNPEHMSEFRYAALHFVLRGENKAGLQELNLSREKTTGLFGSHVVL